MKSLWQKSLEEKFGKIEADWLQTALESWWNQNDPNGTEYDCNDNHRVCQVGDLSSTNEYDDMARQGCCGSVNIELGPSPGGFTYQYGFNYGH